MIQKHPNKFWVIIPASIVFVSLLFGIYFINFQKIRINTESSDQPRVVVNTITTPLTTISSISHNVPNSPPDLVSDEPECLGSFHGFPDGDGPQPTRIPVTNCQKKYSETHLSFDYPCNWHIDPMVVKEVSYNCGFVREFYLSAGDVDAGILRVYPEGSLLGYNKDESKIINSDTLTIEDYINSGWFSKNINCKSESVGKFYGLMCGNVFLSKQGKELISLSYTAGYEKELNKILSTLELKYQ